MEKINDFLNKIYGNGSSSITFYIILGVVALFFIILIIVTLVKSNKENEKLKLKEINKDSNEKELDDENENANTLTMKLKLAENAAKEKIEVKDELSEETIKETPIVENKDENEALESKEVSVEQNNEEDVYVEKPIINGEMMDELPEEKPYVPETPKEKIEKKVEETSSVSSDIPSIDSTVVIDEIGEPLTKEDYTVELPKIKPIEIDENIKEDDKNNYNSFEDVINEGINESTRKEVILEEEHPSSPVEKVELSNAEILAKLSKLKNQNTQVNKENSELNNLMKSMGLTDSSVNQESDKGNTLQK